MPRPTDNAKLTALLNFYESGMPIVEIADLLGLHSGTVHRILNRVGVKEPSPVSAKRLTEEMKVDIVKLYEEGMVVEQIEAIVGCSKPTVYRYVKKAGLTRDIPTDQVELALDDYKNTSKTVAEICKQYGLSKPTFYRRLRATTEK